MANWNDQQQAVLDSLHENKNILVSAAAGSGKTAVLVERILRSIAQGLCHVDEVLVVTFTRAAAAEMKMRILNRLTEEAEKNPTKEMYREAAMADKADFTTIDSFCNRVVRENFHKADVDPSYRLMDTEEAEMLRDDVISRVFDRYYREEESFLELVDFFITAHISDANLKDTIFAISDFADSFADPEAWLRELTEGNAIDAICERAFSDAKAVAEDHVGEVEAVIETLKPELAGDNAAVAEKLLKVFSDDLEKLRMASLAPVPEVFLEVFAEKGPNFPGKACEEAFGMDGKKRLEDLHKAVKAVGKLPDTESLREEWEKTQPLIRQLIAITLDYRAAILQEKKKNRSYEFADINHLAYRVLSDYPAVAERYREKYKYIYIDEYQDSNDLQESVLSLCARTDEAGHPCNVFMVGDVKQSIYRFRLANPELFMRKEAGFSADETCGKLIRLNRNYRSRKAVLDSVNVVFRHVMSHLFGGILYDDAVSLHPPKEEDYLNHYPDAPGLRVGGKTELFLIGPSENTDEMYGDRGEAYILAREIRRLMDEKKQYVKNEAYNPEDPDSPVYRPLEYRDIVVLMRSVRGANDLLEVCGRMNVPIRVEDRQGYFDAEEVMIMLSLFSVLDNRQQDIPLASVMLSPVFDIREEELALVMTEERERMALVEKCSRFAERFAESPDEEYRRIAGKLRNMFTLLDRWEKEKTYMTIADLLEKIWEDTGFDRFAAAMPMGGRRLANLGMLQRRAEVFEENGRRSLFDFVRYIEKCKIHDIDFGEAREDKDGGNTVRVMTMHSSKGLQFPVVFLLRTGRGFMTREKSSEVSLSRTFGIGTNLFRKLENGIRIKETGLVKEEIHRLEKEEMLAEEARLLYVAMTRAEEKLFMVGKAPSRGELLSVPTGSNMKKAKCMLDFIMPVMQTDPDAANLITLHAVSARELKEEWDAQTGAEEKKESLQAAGLFAQLEKEIAQKREEEDSYFFRYAFRADTLMRSKLSVSEVKHAAMPGQGHYGHAETGGEAPRAGEAEAEAACVEKSGAITEEDVTDRVDRENIPRISGGALRGTVIHRIMELLPFTEITENVKMEQSARELLSGPGFSEEERMIPGLMDVTKFYSAAEDSIFQRMRRAAAEGKLYREQRFTAGVPANRIPALGYDSEERVVIQGVIDAWFKETDADGRETAVIVDYKTDRVGSPEELADRYRAQLLLYKSVVESLTHLPVTELILFSTIFGEVRVDGDGSY